MTRDDGADELLQGFFSYVKSILVPERLVPRCLPVHRVFVDTRKFELLGYALNFVQAETNCAGLFSQVVLRDGIECLAFTKD